jgi:hypothetical protein
MPVYLMCIFAFTMHHSFKNYLFRLKIFYDMCFMTGNCTLNNVISDLSSMIALSCVWGMIIYWDVLYYANIRSKFFVLWLHTRKGNHTAEVGNKIVQCAISSHKTHIVKDFQPEQIILKRVVHGKRKYTHKVNRHFCITYQITDWTLSDMFAKL